MYAMRSGRPRLGDSAPTTTVSVAALAQVAALFAFYFGAASIQGNLPGLIALAQNGWASLPPTTVPGDNWHGLEVSWQNTYLAGARAIPVAIGYRIIDLMGSMYNVTPPSDWRTQQAALWAAGNFSAIASGTPQNQTAWYFNSPQAQIGWASGIGVRSAYLPLALPPVTSAVTSALTAAGVPGMSAVTTTGGFPWGKALLVGGVAYVGAKALKIIR